MTVASFKIAFGGKLAEQLEGAIKSHRHSSDPVRQSLAKSLDEAESVSRGGGVQLRVRLGVAEMKLFLEDVNELYRAHAGIDDILEKAQRNRLVGIQANRTKKKIESALASAGV
jgi:hypothetical protein